jgi:Polysaccharide deacetylase
VLAASQSHEVLLAETRDLVSEYRRDYEVPSYEALTAEYYKANRYDPPETAFIKRILQFGLPQIVRTGIVAELFRRHVAVEERTFSRELYMDASHLRCLLSNGMEVGGHGDVHERIGLLSTERQCEELSATRQFLHSIDSGITRDWIMCFPFGNFSAESLEIAAQFGCAAALSVNVDLVHLPIPRDDIRAPVLDRLDTNDLPFTADAAPCAWTRQARRWCSHQAVGEIEP